MHWAPFLLALGPGLVVSAAVYLAARWPSADGEPGAPPPRDAAALAAPAGGDPPATPDAAP